MSVKQMTVIVDGMDIRDRTILRIDGGNRKIDLGAAERTFSLLVHMDTSGGKNSSGGL